MKIEILKLNDIKPYHKNPRKNDAAVDKVANSIEQYGFQQPIVVDKDMVIVAGHTRYKAAKKLSLLEVPVVIAAELTEAQAMAYRLADNKTGEYAKWDDALLTQELRDLLDDTKSINIVSYMSAFSELEIDKLLNGDDYTKDIEEIAKQREDTVITKRVGLLVLKNSYVNRGVATYINGWLEWGLRNNVQVDVISDSEDISNNQFNRYDKVSEWISPQQNITDEYLQPADNDINGDTNDFADYKETNKWIVAEEDEYTNDTKITMRSPIVRMYDSVKLRSSIYEAMTRHTYDALIVNTIDVLFSVVSLGLDQQHPNIYYVTHAERDVGRGDKNFLRELTLGVVKYSNVKIISQSELTREIFVKWADFDESKTFSLTPMLGQPEFLNFNDNPEPKNAILYIGPYEPRKNPEVYINACKQSGKPALVIAPSKKSAEKFKKRFLQEGIEHEIHIALTGKNKVDVMKKAALAIIPSVDETFCFTAFECAHLCRTIVPANRSWTIAHKDWCILEDENNIANIVNEHYNKPQTTEATAALTKVFKDTDIKALSLLDINKEEQKTNNALTKYLETHKQTTLKEFFKSRPSVALDEIFYAINILTDSRYEIYHTLNNTIIQVKDNTK
jgi:ParB/RepB/Spo0J family partition protein